MARLDTIRALEKRGLSPELAEKTVDLGYLLGTLKKAPLKVAIRFLSAVILRPILKVRPRFLFLPIFVGENPMTKIRPNTKPLTPVTKKKMKALWPHRRPGFTLHLRSSLN